jgi:hypothetical protein
VSTHGLQLEESILNQGGRRAFLVVVGHGIDSSADGMGTHRLSVIGLQHVGRRTHILHSGIEPQVVDIWIEDHRHAVVDG